MTKLSISMCLLGLTMVYTAAIASDLNSGYPATVTVTGFLGAAFALFGALFTGIAMEDGK